MKERLSPLIYAWIYAVIIFLGHTVPEGRFSKLARANEVFRILFSDKMLHFLVFGFFAWLLCYGYFKAGKDPIPYVKVFLLSMFYGILIEFWQILIPFRSFQFRDMVFDLLGIVFFMLTFWAMIKARILSLRASKGGEATS